MIQKNNEYTDRMSKNNSKNIFFSLKIKLKILNNKNILRQTWLFDSLQ